MPRRVVQHARELDNVRTNVAELPFEETAQGLIVTLTGEGATGLITVSQLIQYMKRFHAYLLADTK